jgi:HlyD family secretion protein
MLRFLPLALVLVAACGGPSPDAYGNFEVDEVTVSAETDGRLLRYDVSEGMELAAGESVGLVDTTQTALQLRELRARLGTARSGTAQSEADVRAATSELETARRDLDRTKRLFADSAATRQQLDAAENRVTVLEARLTAARSRTSGSTDQTGAVEAQIARLEDRLTKSRLSNPVAGTVLANFAEAGEFVRTGQALYQVAPLDTLTLRAYVEGSQLADLRVGQRVTVRYDVGPDERASAAGVVSWIASDAEFTPTPIQTRDERTDLVYAVKIRVANPDGRLKIGMPADVEFAAPGGASTGNAREG